MIGSFCYRFADSVHRDKMLALLDADDGLAGDPITSITPTEQTGTDGEGQPIMSALPGSFVFLMTLDGQPIEGWDEWLYVPDPWPHEFAGRQLEQLVAEEWAPPAPAIIPTTVPVKLTPQEREARLAARAARLEARQAILDARKAYEKAKAILNAKNAEIQRIPIERAAAVDRVTSNTAARLPLVVDRDAAIAVVLSDTATRDEKIAAREQRDALIEQIKVIDEQLDRDRAYRDWSDDGLPLVRAERDAQRDILTALQATLEAERAKL